MVPHPDRTKSADAPVACVGVESNAIGLFNLFVEDEPAAARTAGWILWITEHHAATLDWLGRPGVLHGLHGCTPRCPWSNS